MTILRGRASQVTDLGDGTVLRAGGFPEREARIMDQVRRHGLPVPAVREVRADSLILDRIDGSTMEQVLRRRPWLARRYAGTLAELHARLHAIPFDEGTAVHFDLHPANVIMSCGGPVLIDWTNAHGGDPAEDVAMTWLILETSAGLGGRLLARLFRARVGEDTIRRGLVGASAFRLADPNVTDAERARVRLPIERTGERRVTPPDLAALQASFCFGRCGRPVVSTWGRLETAEVQYPPA
jgi:aminoglycoside phosphotransferase (APT) family kinase protein